LRLQTHAPALEVEILARGGIRLRGPGPERLFQRGYQCLVHFEVGDDPKDHEHDQKKEHRLGGQASGDTLEAGVRR
jgi:hypothetical protein